MRSHLIVGLLLVGCGETQLGPFQPLPIDARFEIANNDGVIHVARDRFGVSHIFATSYPDLGFAQGYVMAHDRLAQMDVLRRMAKGRLAELFGAVDDTNTIVAFDREMRFFHLEALANEQIAGLGDGVLSQMLGRFAEGVNAYVADVNAGKWTIDPAVSNPDAQLYGLFAPAQWTPWSVADTVAILHLFTIAQSWTVPEELDLTDLDVRARRTLPAAAARDLLALAPIPPIGVPTEAPMPRTAAASRPNVPDALLANARAFFARSLPPELARFGLGPHAFTRPFLGSTAFAVGGDLTGQGAMLAADMETAPTNPSLFYPAHQMISRIDDASFRGYEVAGLMLPGVPFAIAGTNGTVGWAPTRNAFDVADVYYEQFTFQNGGAYVGRGADLVRIVTTEETIDIGEYGNIVRDERMPYEVVEGYGPVIPGHPTDKALSVRYTGFDATDELLTLFNFTTASDARSARDMLKAMKHGPQFMLVDKFGGMVWASDTRAPVRASGALAWSTSSPDGGAPFFVLDGQNPMHAWTSVESTSINYGQLEEPVIVVADADPTTATRDGDPLNEGYVGAAYANGLRDARIHALIDIAQPLDAAKLARIQHDTLSTLGERLKPRLVEILTAAPAEARTTLARDVLDAWTLETPIGAVAADRSSAATLLFNTWMHHFAQLAIGDELAQIGYTGALDDDRVARIVYRMLVENQQALCNGSCDPLVVQAARLAVDDLGTNSDTWRWGAAHAFALHPLFPDRTGALVLPGPLEPTRAFQTPGDMFSIDRSDGGWADTDFTPQLTAAYRLQITGAMTLRLELPTGSVLDTRDPHYRDLLERSYLTRTAFDVPFSIDQINEHGESRWEFR